MGQGKLNRLALVAMAAAVTALIMGRSALAADQPAATPASGPVVIATANPEKIAESIHEYQDMAAQMDLDRKSLTNTLNDKKNALTAMQQALSYLKTDSPQYADQQDKLLKASIEYKAWGEETQLALQRQQKTKIKNLFAEIEDAVAQVAQKDGINIVIADQRVQIPENLDNIDVNALRQAIAQRTILYSDSSRDISGEVITLMDKNYASRSAPSSTPTPTPSPTQSPDLQNPPLTLPPTN
jgi:Skp family chaperone for outer membrane proteins